jgi:hypothetical protein
MQLIHKSIFALILSPVLGFIPQKQLWTKTSFLASSSTNEILGDAEVDLKHAKFCADHFGECSLEDMERLSDG